MRAYAKYLEENNILGEKVTKEIMKMFSEEGASK